MTWLIQGTVASLLYYEEKLTKNNPVVQAIPLLSLWYLFNSSCARRSVFLCNSCFPQGSEYTQVIKKWFPWILIHNQRCNQQLWNEKWETPSIHMLSLQCSIEYAWWACLYEKETASNINYLLSCFGKICSKLLAYIRLFNVIFYDAFLDRQFQAVR